MATAITSTRRKCRIPVSFEAADYIVISCNVSFPNSSPDPRMSLGRWPMIRLRVVVFVLLAQCSSLFAQVSVADAARRERDRRQELQVRNDALVKYLVSHSGANS